MHSMQISTEVCIEVYLLWISGAEVELELGTNVKRGDLHSTLTKTL